ncbi:hypothetical protein NEMBOFW57_006068 [Staphylotrichum longicolle]|uniref:Uncharacterized protein n=1 Tax=Staphylotrichum longicolle TaxID=669026 RepID=A0AAD4EY73_9PEZI|nr:hypothetical protein NEMBOFW57_006068 [Staphylotrichum longicolle]
MSSRLTTPVSKLTRTFSTTPAVARPSHLLSNATKTAATSSSAGRKPAPITPESEDEAYDPYMHVRVPLLPDSARPHPHAAETPDQPLARAEISVVAANPELVAPAALTEVEGMGVDGVELGFVHLLNREEAQQKEESFEMGAGMIRDLWRGMVEDVMGTAAGTKGGKGPAAAV